MHPFHSLPLPLNPNPALPSPHPSHHNSNIIKNSSGIKDTTIIIVIRPPSLHPENSLSPPPHPQVHIEELIIGNKQKNIGLVYATLPRDVCKEHKLTGVHL